MKKTIAIVGAFDTKGDEYQFIYDLIAEKDFEIIAINFGIFESDVAFGIAYDAEDIAKAAGEAIQDLRKARDRGKAMVAVSNGLRTVVRKLFLEKQIDGIIGMGGTGGSSVICGAMSVLPIGFPKVCVSTVASGDTSEYVGAKDIAMIYSVADVAGLNRITRKVFREAAGSICGMVEMASEDNQTDKPIIVASMFGNTTKCVEQCKEMLADKGYEVLVFHCTGSGGRTMESLVDEGLVDAVLDITTTEWADHICGGVFDAGEDRLSAPGRKGVPHLIVPGCIDMCNFGSEKTVPEQYRDRCLSVWNPLVTLMRTNSEENKKMGSIFASKANKAIGPVSFLIPMQGFSILDSVEDGKPEVFWDPEADASFLNGLLENLKSSIAVVEYDAHINDQSFSEKAVGMLLNLIEKKHQEMRENP